MDLVAAVQQGVGRSGVPVNLCSGWSSALRLRQRHAQDSSLFRDLDRESARLQRKGASKHGADLLDALIADITGMASDTAHAAAANAALCAGLRDSAAARRATAEAEKAARYVAEALAAGEPEHEFVYWFALFEAGRWPIGTIDDVFWLF
jgi:hypothetical protein